MDIFPNQARCKPLVPQVAIDRVVAHFVSRMVRVVRDRVVDLAYQQILAIVQSGRAFRWYAQQFTASKVILGLPAFKKIVTFCVNPFYENIISTRD